MALNEETTHKSDTIPQKDDENTTQGTFEKRERFKENENEKITYSYDQFR